MRLRPIGESEDIDVLARELAPGFGGETETACDLLAQTFHLLTADPRPDPWGCYLAYEGEAAIGTCAFKSAPKNGEVEIAYMTFPAFERRGHATAMAAELTRIAFAAGVLLVIAHTLPEENASTRALRRNGFAHAGDAIDPEDGPVWRWERAAAAG